MERSKGLLPCLAVGCFWLAACTTDVDYLRAGSAGGPGAVTVSGVGTGGGDPGTGTGTSGAGGVGGSSGDDAGESVDSGADTEQVDDGFPADTAAPDAADGAGGPRPTGITFGVAEPTAQLMPSAGGSSFTDTCASGEAVVGFTGTIDAPPSLGTYPKSIQVICGLLSVASEEPFAVKTAMTHSLPARGAGSTVSVTRACPADQVVVGFDGRVGMYIDQLIFRCATLTISEDRGAYVLSIGQPVSIDPIGGMGGMIGPQINCAAGTLGIGSIVRAGFAIDAFGLACAKPSVATSSEGDP